MDRLLNTVQIWHALLAHFRRQAVADKAFERGGSVLMGNFQINRFWLEFFLKLVLFSAKRGCAPPLNLPLGGVYEVLGMHILKLLSAVSKYLHQAGAKIKH